MNKITYVCKSCDDMPEFGSMELFQEHLLDVHNVDTNNPEIHFEGTMGTHVDSETQHTTAYHYEGHGVKFMSIQASDRDQDDPWLLARG